MNSFQRETSLILLLQDSRNSRLRRRFPHPPGERRLWGAGAAPYVAAEKKYLGHRSSGAFGAPNGFKNFRRAMRIANMCLVLKLDESGFYSGRTDRITEPYSTVLIYRYHLNYNICNKLNLTVFLNSHASGKDLMSESNSFQNWITLNKNARWERLYIRNSIQIIMSYMTGVLRMSGGGSTLW